MSNTYQGFGISITKSQAKYDLGTVYKLKIYPKLETLIFPNMKSIEFAKVTAKNPSLQIEKACLSDK